MRREDKQAIANWFSTWEKLIGRIDYVLARELFDSEIIGFGTHMDTVKGLEHLEQDQWRHVWPTIDGVHFDLDTLECMISPDRLQGVGIVVWHSMGYLADGSKFDRPGRSTVIFKRPAVDHLWKGVHTHISLHPGTPQQSFGNLSADN